LPRKWKLTAFVAHHRIATAPGTQHVETGDTVIAVVLNPWEANALMPAFRAGRTAARLHLFAPRTCLATRSAEDLLLYTTPALPTGWRAPQTLVLMLLLFAGQLYLRTYNDYVDMCQLLGAPYRTGAARDEEEGPTGDELEVYWNPTPFCFSVPCLNGSATLLSTFPTTMLDLSLLVTCCRALSFTATRGYDRYLVL